MKTGINNYTIDDIETLSFREGVRTRIQMYLGSNDMQGVYNSIQEIISNSIDEYYMGFGDKITIGLGVDNLITVVDEGRGIPFGIKEDGSNVLVDIFTKSHTGGKFNNKVYQSVAGLNGIGAKATCLSSKLFRVSVCRDNVCAEAKFEEGNLIEYKETATKKIGSGTQIQFIPDPKVFSLESIKVDFEVLCEKCKNLSYLTKGLTFILEDHTVKPIITRKYCAKNGLLDLVKSKTASALHTNPLYFELKEKDVSIEVAFQWTKDSEQGFVFTNGLQNTEGGTSLTGFKTAITRKINKELGKNLPGEMVRKGLVYAISAKVPNPSFANQTKTKINNPELRGLADKAFCEAFDDFRSRYPNEIKQIYDYLLREEKAEKAAERARAAVLESNKEVQKELKKKTVLAGKLTDCRFHDENSQLVIVEGKSAGGSIIKARNSETTACLPLRGKPINVLKNDLDDIMKNEEIKDLNIALGCGFGENFSMKKLRYGRVVIMADADQDGYSIMCLVLAIFYKFYPELLLKGKVYWGMTPLFKVTKGNQVYYAYTDEELAKLPKGEVQRLKGLGEATTSDFTDTIFSPDGRYIQFTMKDGEQAYYYFNMLLGKEIEQRRNYLFENIDFEKIED